MDQDYYGNGLHTDLQSSNLNGTTTHVVNLQSARRTSDDEEADCSQMVML